MNDDDHETYEDYLARKEEHESRMNYLPPLVDGREEWSRVAALFGQRVRTPDGVGILLGANTPTNGLYCSWPLTTWTVWYGTDNVQNGWTSKMYQTREVQEENGNGQERIE